MISRRDKRLQQLITILKYLKIQQCLDSIAQQCLAYQAAKDHGVLSILINVDLMLLADMNSSLANLITDQPLEGTALFREVVHEILVTKGLLPEHVDQSEVSVSIRVLSSTLPSYRWACGQLGRYGGLIKLNGIVLGVTATVTYTKSTRYICGREACEGHHGSKYVRIHIPGASEQETVGQKFICYECGDRLEEEKSQRNLSDKLLAEVVDAADGEIWELRSATGRRQQAVAVVIRDDLCMRVQLGQTYDIIGTQRYVTEGDRTVKLFEACNIIQAQDTSYEKTVQLTPQVQRLHSGWNHVPFVFPNLMALAFANEVCPGNSFFKLKMLLLISLTLTPDDPALHILAVCAEKDVVGRLLEFASRLAPRIVTHTSQNVLGAKTSASKYPWAPYFVQGGSLVLATGGVCKILDLKVLKKAGEQELQTALTERKVQVALESRYTGGLPRVLSLPLSCQVWALTTISAALNDSAVTYGATAGTSNIPPALMDAFSVVSYCDVNLATSTDVTEDLVAHLLISSMTSESAHTETRTGLDFDDFKRYIEVSRSLKTVMTVEAEWLLTSYLIAARQQRSHTSLSFSGTAVPITAWNALQGLAHGLCRLSLRTEVLEADAIMGIVLYEETLTAKNGVSGLNVFPEPHLPAAHAERYLTTQLVSEMHKFHSRLLSFCGAGSRHGHISEE